ncbi:MAG: Transcriptional regulator [Thermoleophilia bacterium]|nr:Transcriptional regulator [Thermoleophilia bacterium]
MSASVSRVRVPAPARATVRPAARTARRMAAVLALATLLLAVPPASAINTAPGQNADRLVGSTSFTDHAFGDGSRGSYALHEPLGVGVDGGGSVYVADSSSNRIMRWAATPAADGAAASQVLEQPTPFAWSDWANACSGGSTLPEQLYVQGDSGTANFRMAVADRYSSRVVLYTAEPTANNTTGTVFLGQPSSGGCQNNRGLGTPAANSFDSPSAAWTNGTRVAVADTENNRVLLWDSFPVTGQAADHVLGQADFVSGDPNRNLASPSTSAAANTLQRPKGVYWDGTYLYVADSTNNRVLVWNGWPSTDGAAANWVIGQPDFATITSSCSSTKLSYPVAITTTGSGAGHRLAISVEKQNRVVVLNAFPSAPGNGPTFSSVLGQSSLGNCNPNRAGATAAANTLRAPGGANFDTGGALWVSDTANHRVLRFAALATGTSANRVLGHSSFTTNTLDDNVNDDVLLYAQGNSQADPMGAGVSVAPDGRIAVADPYSSQVLLWGAGGPASDNDPFAVRLGQTARTNAGANGPGNVTTATSVCDPADSWTDGTRLLVADTCNNRVLVWTAWPTTDTTPPDYVIGQATTTGAAAATTQSRLRGPQGVTSDGTDVYVSDSGNNRIMVWRGFWAAPSTGSAATVVLGQASWTAGGAGTSSTALANPRGIDVDGGRLAVAERGNDRVSVWVGAATLTNDAPIDAIIGQADATSAATGTITENTRDVTLAGGGIGWSGGRTGTLPGCRAYLLDPVPTTGFVTTGASDIATGCSGTTTAANRVNVPIGIDAANGQIWVVSGQSRIMRWTDTTPPTVTTAPTATVRCDGTVTINWATSESTTTEVYWDSVTRASYNLYASSYVDASYTGLTHSYDLSFATPGTRYLRVRGVDWNNQAVVSGEVSFTVPPTCPAPTGMLGDDSSAQVGPGRPNPSATNAPAIDSVTFHTSWNNAAGVTMDRVEAETWTTPPEQAGGLWHLDGGLGADTNSQDAGVGTWTGAASWVPGRFGQAASVNGTVRRVTLPDAPSVRKANDFTFDLWFRTGSIANALYPVMALKSSNSCGPVDSCNYSLEWQRSTNELCAAVITTAGVEVDACRTAAGLLDNAWHHAAMTVTSGNQLSLYVDGAPAAGPIAMGNPARTSTDPITVGGSLTGTAAEQFIGEVDEPHFAPMAYDAATVLGYYRTQRAHATRLWGSTPTGLAANCTLGVRCEDQAYAGVPDILHAGARYWQRTRFNTLNNDYWSDWGLDWLETRNTSSISISVGATVPLGVGLPGTDAFGSSTVQVTTDSASGYQLLARDESDAWGLERVGGGPNIPDRQDGSVAPAPWATGAAGFFGVTVRDATGGRLAKWGPGTGWPETDVTNNRYTALEATSDVLLHERTTYGTATDSVVVTWRADAALNQPAGAYDGVMTMTAVASP